MIKRTQTIRQQKPTNYLGVFVHFVGSAIKGLTWYSQKYSILSIAQDSLFCRSAFGWYEI